MTGPVSSRYCPGVLGSPGASTHLSAGVWVGLMTGPAPTTGYVSSSSTGQIRAQHLPSHVVGAQVARKWPRPHRAPSWASSSRKEQSSLLCWSRTWTMNGELQAALSWERERRAPATELAPLDQAVPEERTSTLASTFLPTFRAAWLRLNTCYYKMSTQCGGRPQDWHRLSSSLAHPPSSPEG